MLGQPLDLENDIVVTEHTRPHWAQAGTITFITMRTHDSIPQSTIRTWEREKRDWMRRRGIEAHWSEALPLLSKTEQKAFQRHFNRCREELLDQHLGRCWLRARKYAQIVADALLYFDGERYTMGDFIVMPNHVHLLCAFFDPERMRKHIRSWLSYTARRINKLIGRRGKFWQDEPFDHLVRNERQYEYLRSYIKDNPIKAGLHPDEALYRRYPH